MSKSKNAGKQGTKIYSNLLSTLLKCLFVCLFAFVSFIATTHRLWQSIGAVLIDIYKAFDCIEQSLFCVILNAYGCSCEAHLSLGSVWKIGSKELALMDCLVPTNSGPLECYKDCFLALVLCSIIPT